MAVKNGSLIVLQIASKKIVGETNNSMSFTRDMIETTNKHSANFAKTYIPGEKGATLSAGGLFDPSDTTNWGFDDAFAAWNAGTLVAFIMGGTEKGDPTYSGSAYISSLSKDNPQNDRSTFTVELQVTGEITEGTVT